MDGQVKWIIEDALLLLSVPRSHSIAIMSISFDYCVGDEEEARFVAKRKMLGNIKFIGELGKLEMLHDSILHRCCEQVSRFMLQTLLIECSCTIMMYVVEGKRTGSPETKNYFHLLFPPPPPPY